MIIKYLLILLITVIIIMSYLTYRRVKLENDIIKKQKSFGDTLLHKKKFRLQYVYILLLTILTTGLYINATPLYLKYVGLGLHGDCAFSLEDNVAVVGWSENIFIARVDELKEIREFSILNEDHSPLIDKYRYSITFINDLLGDSKLSNELQIPRSVEYPGVYVSDLCLEDKEILVDEVYLFLGGFVDSEEAERNTDPRNQDGNFYYSYKSVELSGYDINKPLEGQSQNIKDIVSDYQQILNNK
ncbi:hypothetical protein KHQ82_02895 [Mycoplasmatota bacterium]|nr:hypothetical protein KHQ82_02895 [Mycoplasmatota bacterium]